MDDLRIDVRIPAFSTTASGAAVVAGDVPHPEPLAVVHDRTALHPPGVDRAGRPARQDRVAGVLLRPVHPQPHAVAPRHGVIVEGEQHRPVPGAEARPVGHLLPA